jgi:hypothetical protein
MSMFIPKYHRAKEIQRWSTAPTMDVWLKPRQDSGKWILVDKPISWTSDGIYILDDEYAEVRKAYYDGKVIQKFENNDWIDCVFEPQWDTSPPENFRVKRDTEIVYQWIIQVNNPEENGFENEFFLTGLMGEDEVKEKYKDSLNLKVIRKLVESEKYRLVSMDAESTGGRQQK